MCAVRHGPITSALIPRPIWCVCVCLCVCVLLRCYAALIHNCPYFKSSVSSLLHGSVPAPPGQHWHCCRIMFFLSLFPGMPLNCLLYCADPCVFVTLVYLNPTFCYNLSRTLIKFSFLFFLGKKKYFFSSFDHLSAQPCLPSQQRRYFF